MIDLLIMRDEFLDFYNNYFKIYVQNDCCDCMINLLCFLYDQKLYLNFSSLKNQLIST